MEALDHFELLVDDGLVAAVAAQGPDVVGGALAAPHTVAVAVLALAEGVVVLGAGAGAHAEGAVLHVLALDALAGPGAGARHVALAVALPAGLVVRALVEPLHRVAGLHALRLRHEVLAGEAQLVAGAPAALAGALGVTDVGLLVTHLRGLVVLQQRVVGLRLHDLLPADVLGVAQVVVLQDGHGAGPDLVQGLEVERLEAGLDDVEGAEVLRQVSAADDLEVAEGGEVEEARVVRLDVDVARHLLERAEHLQLVGVHGGVAGPEGEVGPDLLEPVECGVEDGEAALQHRAVAEVLDVAGVDRVGELADLGAGAVAGDTLPVLRLHMGVD